MATSFSLSLMWFVERSCSYHYVLQSSLLVELVVCVSSTRSSILILLNCRSLTLERTDWVLHCQCKSTIIFRIIPRRAGKREEGHGELRDIMLPWFKREWIFVALCWFLLYALHIHTYTNALSRTQHNAFDPHPYMSAVPQTLLSSMSEEEFENHRQSLITTKEEKDKRLQQEVKRNYWEVKNGLYRFDKGKASPNKSRFASLYSYCKCMS